MGCCPLPAVGEHTYLTECLFACKIVRLRTRGYLEAEWALGGSNMECYGR